MTRRGCWDGRLRGTPAELQVRLQSLGSPCSSRSPEASPQQLTTKELRGSEAATTTKESPMSPTDPGSFTNPAATHPAKSFTPLRPGQEHAWVQNDDASERPAAT